MDGTIALSACPQGPTWSEENLHSINPFITLQTGLKLQRLIRCDLIHFQASIFMILTPFLFVISYSYKPMHMPLCLRASTPRIISSASPELTPSHPNPRTDSLVFSITSQKHPASPKETILLESKQQAVSKELESLHHKLHCLESRVSNINSADATPNPSRADLPQLGIEVEQFAPVPARRRTHTHHKEEEKENRREAANSHVGRIVRKNNSFLKKKNPLHNRAVDHLNCTSKSHTSTTPHHTQYTEQPHPSQVKQYSLLQKQVSNMRRSMERSQRSKSAASEQLSASKSTIRSLKKQEKKQQGALNKLRRELKKSEAIREKQKQVIATQQKQIAGLLKQLSQLNKLR